MLRVVMTTAAMLIAVSAHAQTYAPPAVSLTLFQAQQARAVPRTVREVMAKPSFDEYMVLEGTLVRHVSGTRYVFADATGQIPVVIEVEDFPAGLVADGKMRVSVYGEADTSEGQLEIDVNAVSVVTPTDVR